MEAMEIFATYDSNNGNHCNDLNDRSNGHHCYDSNNENNGNNCHDLNDGSNGNICYDLNDGSKDCYDDSNDGDSTHRSSAESYTVLKNITIGVPTVRPGILLKYF